GKGLGIQFLRHIERNNILLFLVACNEDIERQYRALLNELKEYRKDLLDKPRILAITKLDLKEGFELDEPVEIDDVAEVIEISAATGHNVEQLKEKIWEKLQKIGDYQPS
ncbi:MAG: GTPase ObgE, partial [Bacteroidota bacterium]